MLPAHSSLAAPLAGSGAAATGDRAAGRAVEDALRGIDGRPAGTVLFFASGALDPSAVLRRAGESATGAALEESAGRQFDPGVVSALVRVLSRRVSA